MTKLSAKNAKKSEILKKNVTSAEKSKFNQKMKPILKLEWLFALNVSSGFIKNVMNYLKIMKKIILIYFLKIKSIIALLVEAQSKSKNLKTSLIFSDNLMFTDILMTSNLVKFQIILK